MNVLTPDGPELGPSAAEISRVDQHIAEEKHVPSRSEVLSVIDIPFDRKGPLPKKLLTIDVGDGVRDSLEENFDYNDKLARGLSGLAPLKEETARIFDIGGCSREHYGRVLQADWATIDHILETYVDLRNRKCVVTRKPTAIRAHADIHTLSFQWQNDARLDPEGAFGHLYAKTAGGSTIQSTYLLCLNCGHDRLLVISFSRAEYGPREIAANECYRVVEGSNYLSKGMWTRIASANETFISMRNGKRDNLVKLLMLDFFASSLYLQPPQVASMWPSGRIALNEADGLEEEDHYAFELNEHEVVLSHMHDLSDAIDFICEALLSDSKNPADEPTSQVDVGKFYSLQKTCRQRLAWTMRSREKLVYVFEAINKVHNIQESIRVKRLTVLATIFLPLSLSTSILSIQGRFVDLGPKLYDFVGVFVIVGSAAVLLLLLAKAISRLKKSQFWELLSPRMLWQQPSRWHIRVFSVVMAISYCSAVALTIASFVIGMVENVVLGVKILGFGLAGVIGFPIVCYVCAWVVDPKVRREIRITLEKD